MTTRFDDIVADLTGEQFQIIREYVLDTVRAEFGPLIQAMQAQAFEGEEYSAGTGEPIHEPVGEKDQPDFGDFLKAIGIKGHDAHDDQHLRYHALQMALAFCHETDKDPMVHANLFYGFLTGA